ncbi:hypothetical protein [Nostoc sp. C057]|uniref:hypothetical protein n=1 Tax=Nostoc sp. C057 TaxID=2576903 RepID=UPI0015C3593B|nr:hypothetical protein [Nostoc sp. C057]
MKFELDFGSDLVRWALAFRYHQLQKSSTRISRQTSDTCQPELPTDCTGGLSSNGI